MQRVPQGQCVPGRYKQFVAKIAGKAGSGNCDGLTFKVVIGYAEWFQGFNSLEASRLQDCARCWPLQGQAGKVLRFFRMFTSNPMALSKSQGKCRS